jgi:eukaryotic-like serine/threonine-protein kinase
MKQRICRFPLQHRIAPEPNGGGYGPIWSPNGRELFYQTDGGRVQVANYVVKADAFVAAKPRFWSERRLANLGFSICFDVAPDGKRVLALLDAAEAKPETHLRVLLNVDSELRRRRTAGNSKSLIFGR